MIKKKKKKSSQIALLRIEASVILRHRGKAMSVSLSIDFSTRNMGQDSIQSRDGDS